MTVSLPNVTLVVTDNVAHGLAELALRDTLSKITPANVVVFSDRAEPFASFAPTFRLLAPGECKSVRDADRLFWYEVPKYVQTSHVLHIEWDSWVLDETLWDPSWLELDYIGAPWWYKDGLNVGNAGFSLRSLRLMEHLAEHKDLYPLHDDRNEDDTLCRLYRPRLEDSGFVWGTQAQADAFSFERIRVPTPTFGFHGLFNFPLVLGPEELLERISQANDYVRAKSEWREMMALYQSHGARR